MKDNTIIAPHPTEPGKLVVSSFGRKPDGEAHPELPDMNLAVDSVTVEFPPEQPGVILLVSMGDGLSALYISRENEMPDQSTLDFITGRMRDQAPPADTGPSASEWPAGQEPS